MIWITPWASINDLCGDRPSRSVVIISPTSILDRYSLTAVCVVCERLLLADSYDIVAVLGKSESHGMMGGDV